VPSPTTSVACLFWLALVATPTSVGAQESAHEPAQEAPTEGLLVLRPERQLRRVANRVAQTLRRRTGQLVEVGDAPPPVLLEAVPRHHVGLGWKDDGAHVIVVLGGDEGRSYLTEIEADEPNRDATVRAIALAIEALQDAAQDGPGEEDWNAESGSGGRAHYTLIPMPRVEPVGALAKPTIYFRLLIGYSPTRNQVLIGPGAGLGLCLGRQCVVIEGDLPLLADEHVASDGAVISYRPVNIAVRGQYRPDFGDTIIPGISIGLLTRIGNATVQGTELGRTVSNIGLRGSLEVAWRFMPRFEWVFEGGVDLALSRSEFIRYGEVVLLEDLWTPWFGTSLRLRP